MHYRIQDNTYEQHKDQIRAAGLVLAVTIGLPIVSAILNHTYVHYPWPWGGGNGNAPHASVVSANPATGMGANGTGTTDKPGKSGTPSKNSNAIPGWMNGSTAAAYMVPLPTGGGKGSGPVGSAASAVPTTPCPPATSSTATTTPVINPAPVTSTVTSTIGQVTTSVSPPAPSPAPSGASGTSTGSSGTTSTPLPTPLPVTPPVTTPPTSTTSVTSPVSSTSVSTKTTDTKLNADVGGVQAQVDANLSKPSVNLNLGL